MKRFKNQVSDSFASLEVAPSRVAQVGECATAFRLESSFGSEHGRPFTCVVPASLFPAFPFSPPRSPRTTPGRSSTAEGARGAQYTSQAEALASDDVALGVAIEKYGKVPFLVLEEYGGSREGCSRSSGNPPDLPT